MYKHIDDVPLGMIATQEDGGWYCDDCDEVIYWQTPGFLFDYGAIVCEECAKRRMELFY